jgi:hypothetical protein
MGLIFVPTVPIPNLLSRLIGVSRQSSMPRLHSKFYPRRGNSLMEIKKAYEHPKSGIFYMIPDPRKLGSYTVYSELQEEQGDPVTHIFLFKRVLQILSSRFKKDLEDVDAYTGIPRGRIIEPNDIHGNWLITHGADFPIDKYKDEIISDFSLRDAVAIGKVKYEVTAHEKMSNKDRKEMESLLGIEFTSTGWTK